MTLLDCDFTSTLAEILDSNLPSIRWNALDGSTICIHDLQSLVTDVLPSFYFHDNYVKFYRDLRSRGFRKISSHKRTHGALVEFYHPEFTRDIIDGVNDAEEEEVPEEEQQHIQGGFLSISQLKAMQEAIVGMGLMVQEMLHEVQEMKERSDSHVNLLDKITREQEHRDGKFNNVKYN